VQKILPPGVKFGRGWVGEEEKPSGGHLKPPEPAVLPSTVVKTGPAATPAAGAKADALSGAGAAVTKPEEATTVASTGPPAEVGPVAAASTPRITPTFSPGPRRTPVVVSLSDDEAEDVEDQPIGLIFGASQRGASPTANGRPSSAMGARAESSTNLQKSDTVLPSARPKSSDTVELGALEPDGVTKPAERAVRVSAPEELTGGNQPRGDTSAAVELPPSSEPREPRENPSLSKGALLVLLGEASTAPPLAAEAGHHDVSRTGLTSAASQEETDQRAIRDERRVQASERPALGRKDTEGGSDLRLADAGGNQQKGYGETSGNLPPPQMENTWVQKEGNPTAGGSKASVPERRELPPKTEPSVSDSRAETYAEDGVPILPSEVQSQKCNEPPPSGATPVSQSAPPAAGDGETAQLSPPGPPPKPMELDASGRLEGPGSLASLPSAISEPQRLATVPRLGVSGPQVFIPQPERAASSPGLEAPDPQFPLPSSVSEPQRPAAVPGADPRLLSPSSLPEPQGLDSSPGLDASDPQFLSPTSLAPHPSEPEGRSEPAQVHSPSRFPQPNSSSAARLECPGGDQHPGGGSPPHPTAPRLEEGGEADLSADFPSPASPPNHGLEEYKTTSRAPSLCISPSQPSDLQTGLSDTDAPTSVAMEEPGGGAQDASIVGGKGDPPVAVAPEREEEGERRVEQAEEPGGKREELFVPGTSAEEAPQRLKNESTEQGRGGGASIIGGPEALVSGEQNHTGSGESTGGGKSKLLEGGAASAKERGEGEAGDQSEKGGPERIVETVSKEGVQEMRGGGPDEGGGNVLGEYEAGKGSDGDQTREAGMNGEVETVVNKGQSRMEEQIGRTSKQGDPSEASGDEAGAVEESSEKESAEKEVAETGSGVKPGVGKERAGEESAGKESAEEGRAENGRAEAEISGRSSVGEKARPQGLELPRFDSAAGLENPTHLSKPVQTSLQEGASQVRQVAPLNQPLTLSPNLEPQPIEEPPSTPTFPITHNSFAAVPPLGSPSLAGRARSPSPSPSLGSSRAVSAERAVSVDPLAGFGSPLSVQSYSPRHLGRVDGVNRASSLAQMGVRAGSAGRERSSSIDTRDDVASGPGQ
jgi:hypothetical protein